MRPKVNKGGMKMSEQTMTAFEWEVVRDIMVNSGQDKFHGSYPLMRTICDKVIAEWSAAKKAEGIEGYDPIVPPKEVLAQYGLSVA